MPRLLMCLAVVFVAFQRSAFAEDVVALGQIRLELPAGWTLAQTADNAGTRIIVLQKGLEFVTFYKQAVTGLSLSQFASSEAATVQAEASSDINDLTWKRMAFSMNPRSGASKVFTSSFLMEFRGTTYWGASHAPSLAGANSNAELFLSKAELVSNLATRSLTDIGFKGKKYYFGWGAAAAGDSQNMHNEVKYDVLHTHQIFSKDVGGNYETAATLFGPQAATASAIRNHWKEIGNKITSRDMFMQYSSGHGFASGLAVGVNFNEMRDTLLAYPAKEVVIFTMACESGGLVDSFNKKKSTWENWPAEGRSLLVLVSSKTNENSSTGPGKDPSEPGGGVGSAGSAFGHALWKALAGAADGFVDGFKDGFVSLGELRDYTIFRTKQIAPHTPVQTGAYVPYVIMNRVPSASFLASLPNGTEGLSDAQIEEEVRKLNQEWSVSQGRI